MDASSWSDRALITVFWTVMPALALRYGRKGYVWLRTARTQKHPPRPHLRTYVALIALHLLYMSYEFIFQRPFNMFSFLRLPLTTPAATMREYLALARPWDHESFRGILQKLQSFDYRAYYVRYGHRTITECDYCVSQVDYEWYTLAGLVFQYSMQAVFAGILTSEWTGKKYTRKLTILTLFIAAVAEAVGTRIIEIKIKVGEESFMWHDRAWWARHTLFTVLPLVLLALPPSAEPSRPLTDMWVGTELLLNRLRLLGQTRSGVVRSPRLRRVLTDYWSRTTTSAEWARADAELREKAEAAEMPFVQDNAKLRVQSQLAVDGLWTVSLVDGLGRPLQPLSAEQMKAYTAWRGRQDEADRQAAIPRTQIPR